MSKLENHASERAVLAGLCQFGLDAYLEMDFVDADHFTDSMNQILYTCISRIINQNAKVDLTSILSTASELGVYEKIHNKREIGFIRSLFNFPIHKENVSIHASKITKLKLARDLGKTLTACAEDIQNVSGDEDLMDIIGKVEEPILDATGTLYQSSNKTTEMLGDGLEEYIEFLCENPTDYVGIPSGFPHFDLSIGGGLRRKSVDLIAARPKTGKSMFGDAVAVHVSKEHNIPVLMLDTEMSKDDHYNRMLASISGVEINKISSGKFSENAIDREKVMKAVEELKSIPYHYISIAGQSFENILAIMRKWIYQHVGFDENGRTKDCLIVYDYLKLMGSEGISASMQEYQVLGFQITKLHNFCVKYDVPCLSFVQLNRDGITKESTDVVSGSDRLIWLCTSFTIFKMKSEEEIAEDTAQYGNRKLVPVVARHGSGLDDGDYISIKMYGSIGKIEESRTRNQIHDPQQANQEGFEIEDDIDAESDLSDL
jgi:replicative DNA helicase